MRLVLDTNTVISGLLWSGAPHQILACKNKLQLDFFSCQELLNELAGVIHRPKFLPRLAILGKDAVTALDDYRGLVSLVTIEPPSHPISRDPDDDIVLACAVAARADLIVSGDNDLISLKQYQHIRILSSSAAVHLLASATP